MILPGSMPIFRSARAKDNFVLSSCPGSIWFRNWCIAAGFGSLGSPASTAKPISWQQESLLMLFNPPKAENISSSNTWTGCIPFCLITGQSRVEKRSSLACKIKGTRRNSPPNLVSQPASRRFCSVFWTFSGGKASDILDTTDLFLFSRGSGESIAFWQLISFETNARDSACIRSPLSFNSISETCSLASTKTGVPRSPTPGSFSGRFGFF